jgi:hypothetical protein
MSGETNCAGEPLTMMKKEAVQFLSAYWRSACLRWVCPFCAGNG